MGIMTNAKLELFAEQTGIRPAEGEQADVLRTMSMKAFELIQIIELERAGVRDGDGYWHGSDPLGATVNDIGQQMDRLRELEHSGSQVQMEGCLNMEEWLDWDEIPYG